jgi:hypothetical protein
MRDVMSEIYKALDELDAVHKKTQVASTPEEIRPLVQETREKYLSAQILIQQVRTLAESGDFFAQQRMESELGHRLSRSTDELERAQARMTQVFGSASEFLILGPSDLPKA